MIYRHKKTSTDGPTLTVFTCQLLIASDVPEALDPLEVKNSQHGGPYTTRTRLGWAVNGPLKRD